MEHGCKKFLPQNFNFVTAAMHDWKLDHKLLSVKICFEQNLAKMRNTYVPLDDLRVYCNFVPIIHSSTIILPNYMYNQANLTQMLRVLCSSRYGNNCYLFRIIPPEICTIIPLISWLPPIRYYFYEVIGLDAIQPANSYEQMGNGSLVQYYRKPLTLCNS